MSSNIGTGIRVLVMYSTNRLTLQHYLNFQLIIVNI